MVSALVVLLAAAVASADDPKKPAAISASTSSSATSKAPASAKPAAVQASTGKTLGKLGEFGLATHLEVVEAYVPLKLNKAGIEIVHDTARISVTVMGHDGAEATISFDEWSVDLDRRPDLSNAGGLTALQILVEQKYVEYKEGVGFVPTQNYLNLRGIKKDKPEKTLAGPKKPNKQDNFMGAEGGPDLVDPGKPESVAEDPSQKGGIFGYGFDGPLENYNPEDPNTPEGKKKVLRDRLSELSRLCWDTPEGKGYLSCNESCNDLLWSEYGRVSQDKVDECRRNCKADFEQNKPRVCHESDAVTAELDQLEEN